MNRLGDVSEATLRERRRFAWRRVRGRLLAWRYLLIGTAIAVIGGLLMWVLEFHGFGGLADAKKVDIVGAHGMLTEPMIEKAAQPPLGESLISVDLKAIRERLTIDPSLHNAIATADVSREWPDTIKIVVTMRTAVALVPISDGKGTLITCDVLDKDGNVFGDYQPDQGACPKGLASLPIVQQPPSGMGDNPYAQAAGVAARMPGSLRALVKYISVPSPDAVSLVLKADPAHQIADGTTVVWGSADNTQNKVRELLALMKANPGAHGYNVSVISSPAVLP